MTVRTAGDGTIVLEGRCPVDDVETLMRLLALDPSAIIDWRGCEQVHTAIIQILLSARPAMRGPPGSILLRNWIEPIFAGGNQ